MSRLQVEERTVRQVEPGLTGPEPETGGVPATGRQTSTVQRVTRVQPQPEETAPQAGADRPTPLARPGTHPASMDSRGLPAARDPRHRARRRPYGTGDMGLLCYGAVDPGRPRARAGRKHRAAGFRLWASQTRFDLTHRPLRDLEVTHEPVPRRRPSAGRGSSHRG